MQIVLNCTDIESVSLQGPARAMMADLSGEQFWLMLITLV
jgi:hypothetical protein